jgi:alkylation response protein AidB-like acyl-CoA dehydrogenase
VDFTYDAEQEALRDVARRATAELVDPTTLRELADDPAGVTDERWAMVAELGWTGLLVPERLGGSGAGLLEMGIVLEQMGRIPFPGPFFSSAVLATLAARALGLDDLLADLASGARRGTVALQEAGQGNPVDTVRSRVRRRDADWVVDGLKPLVLDGHTADWALVVARGEDGVRSFLLESPGGEPVPTLDPTRKGARLALEATEVTPVGPPGNHAEIWRRVVDDASVALAAETVGCAERALEMAIAYTTDRVVFDRPVASFQVAKHKMVDMYHHLEMARVGWQYAAWCSDAEDPERARAAAMAASYAAEAGVGITGDNIQLHGGLGFTWGVDAHFLFKRVKQNEVLCGGRAHDRQRLASLLVQSA